MAAFSRQASNAVLRDYGHLRQAGWPKIDAAVEAWETERAGEALACG